VVPSNKPIHVHVQGPEPATAEAFPAEQRLVVGAETKDPPFEEPQTPFKEC
jgi:hypothetical protein